MTNFDSDLEDVKLHTTQAIEAVGRKYQKLSFWKRFMLKAFLILAVFFAGFITCYYFNRVPTEGIIEKIAAQPDLKNKAKGRYDRPMEYAIMHECIFAKGTPRNELNLIKRINYCTCALQSVQQRKPYQKMFENNLVDFTFKIREENLCKEEKIIPVLDSSQKKK